LSVFAVK